MIDFEKKVFSLKIFTDTPFVFMISLGDMIIPPDFKPVEFDGFKKITHTLWIAGLIFSSY
ncbi:hypothetical protein LI951_05415 [Enterococcus sp. BWT-B8]|uniref:hypothetical protein n=1 Tax=unclassified Enterococcus TaxID=2608891 RepID=UPI001E4E1B10|nr:MULTISPECIES: hypothetical protein [unclassified Enterococcus]MCB5951497.1 hypothetical protein [Enterococcus sp. BWT-B8]MCB5955056.1 hypothetical protein [Enterococcus sp. CWB-B31]